MLDKLQFLAAILLTDRKPEKGATATEYALLVALIAFGIILGVTFFGTELNTFFNDLGTTVAGWAP